MSTTGFTVNAHRIDPYKTFKFRILMDNLPVLGVSKVSALKKTTEVIKHRSGGQNSIEYKTPGQTTYDAVTMERGITHDMRFHNWASQIHTYVGDTS
ncbi:MAG: phage tail protein, partial [Candidatus Hodarchaeales archaeon]